MRTRESLWTLVAEGVVLERLLLLPLGLDVVVLRLEAVHPHTLELRLKLIAHELVNHGIEAINWRCLLNLLLFAILVDHLGPGYCLLLLHFEILTPVAWLSLLVPVKGLELLIDLSQENFHF